MFHLFGNKKKKQEERTSLLSMPIDSPEKMDQLWFAYEETGNPEYVRRVISILDWDDKVRVLMEAWFQTVTPEEFERFLPKFAAWMFPMQPEDRTIDGPLDLDLQVALLARDGKLKLEELPVEIPKSDLVRLSMKSAAIWSLASMSKQNPEVSKICQKESKIAGGAARLLLANASN